MKPMSMLKIPFRNFAVRVASPKDMGLKDKVAIVGYGETPFSRARVDKGEVKLSVQEYFAWACDLALKDAGLEKRDIDGQGLGVTGASYPHSEIYSAEIAQDLGFSPSLLLRGDHGGANGAAL